MRFSVLVRDTLWSLPFWAAVGVAIAAGSAGVGHAAEPPAGPAILQQLRSFATMGSVLYVAAHPDDENTQVITYLARGRGYRTAYLSLTRGDGGQNLRGSRLRRALPGLRRGLVHHGHRARRRRRLAGRVGARSIKKQMRSGADCMAVHR